MILRHKPQLFWLRDGGGEAAANQPHALVRRGPRAVADLRSGLRAGGAPLFLPALHVRWRDARGGGRLQDEPGPLFISYERDSELKHVYVKPFFDDERDMYRIGIVLDSAIQSVGFMEAVQRSFVMTGTAMQMVFRSFGMLFSGEASFKDLRKINYLPTAIMVEEKEIKTWEKFL